MSIHVFGIRHHGPGCARCLRTALTALQPDIMLVEGPPDAQEVLSLAGDQEMQPPIALLIYPPDAFWHPITPRQKRGTVNWKTARVKSLPSLVLVPPRRGLALLGAGSRS